MYSSGRQRYRPTTSLRRSTSKPNLSFSTITEECVPKDIHFPDDEEKRERTQRLRKLQRLRERRYRDFKGLSRSGVTDDYESRFANDLEEFRSIKTGNVPTGDDALSKNQQFEHKFSRFQSKDIYSTLPARIGARKFIDNSSKDPILSPTGSVSSTATVDERFMYGSRFENEDYDYSWRPRQRTYSLSTASNYDYDSSMYSHLNEDGLDDGPFDDTTSEYDYGYSSIHGLKRSFSTCVTPHKYSGMMTPVAMSTEAAATADRLDQIKERLYNLQAMRKERESAEKPNCERSSLSYNKEVNNEQISTSISNYQTSESRYQSLNIPQDNNNNSSRPLWSQRIDLLMSSQKQNDTQHDQNFNQEAYTSMNEATSNVKIVDGSEPVPTDISFDQESFYSFEAGEDDIANIKSINKSTGATETEYDYTDCVDPGSVQISLESYNDNKFLGFEGTQSLESSVTSHTVKPIQLTQRKTPAQSHSKQNYLSKAVAPEVHSLPKTSNLGSEMQNYKDLSRDELLLEIARLKLANIERDPPNTESIAHTKTVETESQVKFLPDDKANINITKLKSVEVGSKISSDNIRYQDPYNASVSINNAVDESVSITAKDSKLSDSKTPSESEEEILSEFEQEMQSESDEQPQSHSHIVDREENFINEKEKCQIEHSMYFKSVTVEKPSVETSENIAHKITEDKLQKQYSPVIKETFEKKQNFSEENLEIASLKDLQNNNFSLETPATQTQVSWNFSETSNSENISSDSLAGSHQESLTKFDTTFDNSNNLTDTFSKETNSVELISQTQSAPYQAPKEITVNESDFHENSLTSRKDEMLETKKLSVDVTITPNNDNISKTKSPEKCNSIAYSSTENEVEMPRVLASSPLFVPSQDTSYTFMNKTTVKDNTDSPSCLNELKTNQMNETLTCKPLDMQNYVDANMNIKEGVDSTKLKAIEIPIKDKGIETFNEEGVDSTKLKAIEIPIKDKGIETFNEEGVDSTKLKAIEIPIKDKGIETFNEEGVDSTKLKAIEIPIKDKGIETFNEEGVDSTKLKAIEIPIKDKGIETFNEEGVDSTKLKAIEIPIKDKGIETFNEEGVDSTKLKAIEIPIKDKGIETFNEEGVDSTKLKAIEIPIKDKGIETFNDKDLSEIPTDSKNDTKYFQTELSTTHSPAKGGENSESYVLKTTKEVVVDQEQGAAIHERFSEDQQESKGKSEFIQDCPPKSVIMPHVTENSKIIISTTKSSEPLYTSSLSVSLPNSPSQLTKDNVDAEPKTETVNLMEHSVETQPSLNGFSTTSNSASIYLVPNKKYISTTTSVQNQFNSDIDGKSDAKMFDLTTLEATPEIKSPEINFENNLKASKADSSFMQVVKTDANDSSVTYQKETSEKPRAFAIGLDALQSKSEDRLNISEQPIHSNNQTSESLNISPQTTLSERELDKETTAEVANLKVYNEKEEEGPNEIFEGPSMISTKLPISSNNTPELTESSFELCHQENVSMKLSPENNSELPNYSISSYQTALPQSSVTENNSLSSPSKIVSVESTSYVQPNFYKDKEDSPILLMKDVPSFDLKDSSELKSPKCEVNADVKDLSTENNNLNSFSTLSPSQSNYSNTVNREFSHESYASSDMQTQNFTTITPKSILVTASPKETTNLPKSPSINIRKEIFGEEINTFDTTFMKPNKSALKLVAPDSGTLIKTKYETEGERIQSMIPRSPGKRKDYETKQFSDNTEFPAKSDTSSKDFPDSSFQTISDPQVVISAKAKTVEIEKPESQPDIQYLATTSLDSMSTIQYGANSNIENVGQHTSEISMELSKNTAFSLERNNSDINSSESDTRYLHGSSQEAIAFDGSKHGKPHQTDTLNDNENKDFSLILPKTQSTQPSSPNMQKLESSADTIPLASNKDHYEIKAPEHIKQKANANENRPTEQWSYEETPPTFSKSNSLPRKKKKPSKTPDSPQSSEKANISAEDDGNVNKKSSQKKWKSVELLQKGNQKKPEVPPKSSGPGLVKSTSMKFLAKFQSKSKKQKSSEEPTDLLHPTLKKGQSEYSVLNSDPSYQQDEFLGSDPAQRTRHYKTLPHKKKENSENAPVQYKSLKKDVGSKSKKEIDSLVSPFNKPLPKQDEDMFIDDRQSFNQWDPSPLFMDLYNIHLVPDDTQDFSSDFIGMEGVMEKLPMNKKKSTLLKTWKRRYFMAKNGWLVYYDNCGDQQPSDEILLMGGTITVMGNNVIGIDDGRGHYLMVRCPSSKEYDQWLAALQSQTVDNLKANYIQPLVDAPKSSYKNILIVEMGSMSVRAGILKENVTLPQIFFPSVVAVNYSEKKHFVGFEAYKPKNRLSSKIMHVFGLSDKVDKFKIEYEIFPSVFSAIFQDLKIKPPDYQVMLVMPLNISKKDKENIMKILMNRFHVQGVCMVTQAITALYSYKSKSGIMVDIGERLEVIPIYDGFAIEGGQSVQSYGAGKIRQSLRSGLAKHNFPLYSPLEQILIRYIMEQTCYVSKNYEEEIQKYMQQPEKFLSSVYLNKYDIPKDTYSTISHDISCFASPEGFFNTDLWGMDYPTVQALVLKAINACPMDNRRHMCRAIYLSGGVTMIPGFAARLEKEVQKLVNPSLLVQVHSSPQRYHAAYIGACILSALPEFQNHCILANEWKRDGTRAFQKWIY
ncbi:uncharacterized protein LOC115213538 isoform X3 [Octopus sinensis]|uniref:Uncharacterized protein LOC115213538 isoform X3 n=1 Tax=Octopus sinensis TaxID=2607531 RepID=A0A6P7SKJ1_9MOLL|nr:uncharacterized protein LOC115213538 isoform X3 [Octopus sinensis]